MTTFSDLTKRLQRMNKEYFSESEDIAKKITDFLVILRNDNTFNDDLVK